MSGKSSRTKGHSFERQLANDLKPIDENARRNVSECQEGGYDILTDLPYAIQAKCLGRWSKTPHAIYEQARIHAKGKIPVGVVKITRKSPILAVLDWDHFLHMIDIIDFYAKGKHIRHSHQDEGEKARELYDETYPNSSE